MPCRRKPATGHLFWNGEKLFNRWRVGKRHNERRIYLTEGPVSLSSRLQITPMTQGMAQIKIAKP
jgi:hypothetical protein